MLSIRLIWRQGYTSEQSRDCTQDALEGCPIRKLDTASTKQSRPDKNSTPRSYSTLERCHSCPNMHTTNAAATIHPATPHVTPPCLQAPPEVEVKVDGVQVLPVVKGITCLRGVCTERLKYEIEYGLKRGTTDNSYLVERNGATVLVDVPVQAYAESYCESAPPPVSMICSSLQKPIATAAVAAPL
jgi:hypothetical protein